MYLKDCVFSRLVTSLHEFGEVLDEVSIRGVLCVLGVTPFVSYERFKRGRSHCSRREVYSYFVGALLVPGSIRGY